jgi:hypothetical protein
MIKERIDLRQRCSSDAGIHAHIIAEFFVILARYSLKNSITVLCLSRRNIGDYHTPAGGKTIYILKQRHDLPHVSALS